MGVKIVVALVVVGAAGCSPRSPVPEVLSRFAAGAETRLSGRALLPAADVICAIGPYQTKVEGPGAAQMNMYIRDHGIDMSDEASWVLLWKQGHRIEHQRFGRGPIDLANNNSAAERRTPADLRLASCATVGEAVLLKTGARDYARVDVLLTAKIVP